MVRVFDEFDLCKIPGCGRVKKCRGYCQSHLKVFKEFGKEAAFAHQITPYARNKGKTCTYDGCDKPASSKLLCKYHYRCELENREPYYPVSNVGVVCKVCCLNPAKSRHMCSSCYNKAYRKYRYDEATNLAPHGVNFRWEFTLTEYRSSALV